MKKQSRQTTTSYYTVELPHCPLGPVTVQANNENEALLQYAHQAGIVYTRTAAGQVRLESDYTPCIKQESSSHDQ